MMAANGWTREPASPHVAARASAVACYHVPMARAGGHKADHRDTSLPTLRRCPTERDSVVSRDSRAFGSAALSFALSRYLLSTSKSLFCQGIRMFMVRQFYRRILPSLWKQWRSRK
jgi:hypothetical protein